MATEGLHMRVRRSNNHLRLEAGQREWIGMGRCQGNRSSATSHGKSIVSANGCSPRQIGSDAFDVQLRINHMSGHGRQQGCRRRHNEVSGRSNSVVWKCGTHKG